MKSLMWGPSSSVCCHRVDARGQLRCEPARMRARNAERARRRLLCGTAQGKLGDTRGPVALAQLLKPAERALAHEHVEVAIAIGEQTQHQMAADESGGAGQEVGHLRQ